MGFRINGGADPWAAPLVRGAYTFSGTPPLAYGVPSGPGSVTLAKSMSVPSRDGNGAVSFPVIPRTCTRLSADRTIPDRAFCYTMAGGRVSIRQRERETRDNVRSRSFISLQSFHDSGLTGGGGVAFYDRPGRNRRRSFSGIDCPAQRGGLRPLRQVCHRPRHGGPEATVGACRQARKTGGHHRRKNLVPKNTSLSRPELVYTDFHGISRWNSYKMPGFLIPGGH